MSTTDTRIEAEAPKPKSVWPVLIVFLIATVLVSIAFMALYSPDEVRQGSSSVPAPATYLTGDEGTTRLVLDRTGEAVVRSYRVDTPAAGYPAAPASTKP